jgi:hypothetical protein
VFLHTPYLSYERDKIGKEGGTRQKRGAKNNSASFFQSMAVSALYFGQTEWWLQYK